MPGRFTFDEACAAVEAAVCGSVRASLVAELSASRDLGAALRRLRDFLRAQAFAAGGHRVRLAPIVDAYDRVTREEGFHVLHDWDGKADSVNENIIPIDVLDYVIAKRGADPVDRHALAILLDYYFVHVLAVFSLRVWDEGDPNENLARIDRLLQQLQGPNGSGQQFARDAETLMLLATSHFELHERGYAALLDKVKTLDAGPLARIAQPHAVSIGCHLRFGFEATYGRDTIVMRDDNNADYPWLCFALLVLVREYSRRHDAGDADRASIVEAILNGLSADARAFIGEPPKSLSRCEAERVELRETFEGFRGDFVEECEPYRPSEIGYSPLAFFFNFSHNVLKGTIVDAVLRGEPWPLAFNDLLASSPAGEAADAKRRLAATLMGYARANPDRIRGKLTPVIVYDPQAGRRAFRSTMSKIR